jgi:hypothetical protein
MSVLDLFSRAREVLEVGPEEDAAAVKRAYRRKVHAHPPDTDPEGFRRVRGAFELLSDPGAHAEAILLRPTPAVAAPPALAPRAPLPPGALPLAILRVIASQLDADELCRPAERRSS